MLRSMDQLLSRGEFPPVSERARYTNYGRWAAWYAGDWSGLGDQEETKDWRIRGNLVGFSTDFMVGVCWGDGPLVEVAGDTSRWEQRPDLLAAAEGVLRGQIMYGVGVGAAVAGVARSWDPRWWFPVRAARDDSEVIGDMICYPFASADRAETRAVPSDYDRLYVRSFDGGVVESAVYTLNGLKIGLPVGPAEIAVAPGGVFVATVGSGVYGVSPYSRVDDYLLEVHRRESAISTALDRHLLPHLAVPEGTVQQEADGTVDLAETGEVLQVPPGATRPQYVAWTSEMGSSRDSIQQSEERVYRFFGIAPVLVDRDARTRDAISAAALRRLAIPTVQRIRLVRQGLTRVIRSMTAGVLGVDVETVTVRWGAELSTGAVDDASSLVSLVEGGLLPQPLAVQEVAGLGSLEAERFADRWRQEQLIAGSSRFGGVVQLPRAAT